MVLRTFFFFETWFSELGTPTIEVKIIEQQDTIEGLNLPPKGTIDESGVSAIWLPQQYHK
jgi:hypothetical protein